MALSDIDKSPLYVDGANGRVGIGNAAPTTALDVTGTVTAGGLTVDGGGNLNFYGGTNDAQYIKFGDTDDADVGNIFYYHGNNNMVFTTNASEAMRIDSSGRLLVNTNGTLANGASAKLQVYGASALCATFQSDNAGQQTLSVWNAGNSGTRYFVWFESSSGKSAVGSITSNGSSTSYNTTSDYRLKENVVADWDATTRLKQLNPVRFNFIADADTTVNGFLAHEVQDIVPEAISGTKDAMRDEEYEVTPAVLDEDGNEVTPAVMGTRSVPDYQGIDQSKLVPLLVKTIQELEARITALEAN
jgi:hypothetical protein